MRSRRPSSNDGGSASPSEETRVFQRSDVKRPKTWMRTVALVAAVFLLFAGGIVYGFWRFSKSPSETLIPPEYLGQYEGRINILILGIDTGVNGSLRNPQADRTGTRSDVLMVASIDPLAKEIGLLSIPRDTRAYIPEVVFNYEKINHAHAYGGPDLAVKTVQGFLNLDIHHYARIDFQGFEKAVELLGGIDIDVPQDMYYEDPFQNLLIDLKKGPQHLDGEKALGLVRFRGYDNADIGRIQVQEMFLEAVMKKVASVSGVLKLSELTKSMLPYIKTDLTAQDILNLANMVLGVKPEHVKMSMVPGTAQDIGEGDQELSYWVADRVATDKVVNEILRGVSRERNASIVLAIEEGNGIAGSGDALATFLLAEGFHVLSVDLASAQDCQETMVIAKTEKASQWAALRNVKSYCPEAKTFMGKVPDGADVLIVVGKDFRLPVGEPE